MTHTDTRYWSPPWRRLRQMVIDRDRGLCQVREKGCGQVATAVDHIISPLEGGSFWDPANLRASCRHCNSLRGARWLRARQARYRNSEARYDSRF